ncbi:MAG: caspase family protein [Methanosarcinales archaeon]|nr:caspase family protein [Methanosarcinales archaeon]
MLLPAMTRTAAICLLLLCLAGPSPGVSPQLLARADALGTADTIAASPVLERAEMLQTAPSLAGVGGASLMSKENAATLVQDAVVTPFWDRADQSKGLRVLQHGEMLTQGAVVEAAYVPPGQASRKLVAQNPSWLFMIDELPGAHFAHPVKLVLVDAATGERQEMNTDWWPKVNEEALFDKESLRTDTAMITFYRKPAAEQQLSLASGLWSQLGNIQPLITCDVWAVLVCGYDDISDTFDDDTNGMYGVLRNLGVPDDHIFYVSPHSGHTGVDRPTSRTNVRWAIDQVAARADVKDKVVILYSSHGNVNLVSCVPGTADGGSISASEMDTWLDGINCKEMTIIIEACHSGSFIGKYKDGTYAAGETELTGDGEVNRVVFTSASSDTSSWGDVDGDSDPNPADSGSESVYGYIMAFNVASADANGDGRMSFGEAYQYAWNNDVTRILGWNTPQMIEAGLNKANVYHECLQQECYPSLPAPVLTLTGTEDYTTSAGEFTRYKLSVTNWNAYPAELFQAAPDLPPCGLNTASSRTWVDIFDLSGKRLYGFCALGNPSNLQSLWFAVKKGETPPQGVYIVMTDRRCNHDYTSNEVNIGSRSMVLAPIRARYQIDEPMKIIGEAQYVPPS